MVHVPTQPPEWLVSAANGDLQRKTQAYRLATNTLKVQDGTSVSGEDNGWRNLRRVKQLLGKGGWKRSPLQIAFHNKCIAASLSLLFGDSWPVHRREALAQEGLEYEQPLVFGSLPRRFGKTVALSVFTASILLTKGVAVLVMSMSGRAADSLLQAIRESILSMVKTTGAPIIVTANSKTEFAFRLHGVPRSVKSLPSMNIRGQGGDLLLLDEVCFMNVSVLLESILPMAEKKGCVLIAISSPSPTTLHGILKDCTMKDTYSGQERKVFNTLSIQLSCTRCQHEGRAQDCRHLEHLRPVWKDASRSAMFSRLYDSMGRGDTFAAESLGIPSLTRNSIFPISLLQTLFNKHDRPRCSQLVNPAYIIIGSDISGGSHSNTTFVAFCAHQATADPASADYSCEEDSELHGTFEMTMVGLVARKSTGSAMRAIIAEFVGELRKRFPRIPIILAPESSIISFCCCLAEWFCEHQCLCTYYTTGSGGVNSRTNPGVQCTANAKEMWCRICLGVLEQHQLRIAADLVCVGDSDVDSLTNLLLSELTMLRCFPTISGTGVPLISGKANSEGRVSNTMLADDCAIGWCIGLSVAVRLRQNPGSILYGRFTHSVVSEHSKQAWDFERAVAITN